jgi:hypothetical protein
MYRLSIAATFMLGAALFSPSFAPSAQASEAVPASLARQLDGQPAAFTMTDAKRRRLMMMHEAAREQRYQERRRGYGYGYGRHGYGPPPRPQPPYGYGRRNNYW